MNILTDDNIKEMCARYTLLTNDGVLISIINEGLNHVHMRIIIVILKPFRNLK